LSTVRPRAERQYSPVPQRSGDVPLAFACRRKRRRAAASTLSLLAIILFSLPAHAQNISVSGKLFYDDGKPWIAKGVHVSAFDRPMDIESAPHWMNETATKMRATWVPAELNAVKSVFHANTIRFDFSQPALDPNSSIYDSKYLAEVVDAIRLARQAGFVVIAVINAQAPSGLADLPCMPNASTVRAWHTLAPKLANDKGVLMEIYNEPCKGSPDRSIWASGMQAAIDGIRHDGANNILLLDGLNYARSMTDLFPMVHDVVRDRLALAVHPYFAKGWFASDKDWERQFGAEARKYPMIATEWNSLPSGGTCENADMPATALAMIRYLQSLRLGIVGWGIDSNSGHLVKDHEHFEPTDYSTFKACNDGSISGGGKLLANYPNN